MFEERLKINSERINDIKQNSFVDNYIKSMNNSISSQKMKTQNSTCSSYLKSIKSSYNEDNILIDIKSIKKDINESLHKNLCISSYNKINSRNASNLKKMIYKKKQVNSIISQKGINSKIKKINIINEEFSKKINNKEKKEFNDLTLDEYLKEQIKYINNKIYNENKENENNKSLNIKNNNIEYNNKTKKNNNKNILNNKIEYNNYKNISNKIELKQKYNPKKSYIILPKPKQNIKNNKAKILRININKKNNIFNHKKYKSLDGSTKKLNINCNNSFNLNDETHRKFKIVNLKIDLNELLNDSNKEIQMPKKKFQFSKSYKKNKESININNFMKDFFILPKLQKF